MAQAIITEKGREKLCKAHAGDIVLPKITHMVLGSGGVDEQGEVKTPTGKETELHEQKIKKALSDHSFPIPTTCRYTMKLEKNELANEYISEQGLVDSDGDLVAYKTFLPKGKDEDMEFVFSMDEIF